MDTVNQLSARIARTFRADHTHLVSIGHKRLAFQPDTTIEWHRQVLDDDQYVGAGGGAHLTRRRGCLRNEHSGRFSPVGWHCRRSSSRDYHVSCYSLAPVCSVAEYIDAFAWQLPVQNLGASNVSLRWPWSVVAE